MSMSTSNLIRWSGLALILGAAALAVHFITHPPGEPAQYVAYPLWAFSHWLAGIAWLLILFGLMGVYARQAEKVGLLGLIGFILAVLGIAVEAGGVIILGAILQPFIAAQQPGWLDLKGPLTTLPAFRLTFNLMSLAVVAGFLLLGIATLRAAVLPRLGAWLVILAVP